MFRLHPWKETVFPLLRSHGYYTGIVGKWHLPFPEPEMSMAFDYRNNYFGHHWENRNGKMRHVTDLNLEDSLYFLRTRPKKKNFALKISFFATHARDNHYPSYEPMNKTKALWYNNVTIPMPKTNTEKHYKELPSFFRAIKGNGEPKCEGRTRWKMRFEPDYYQQSIKDLYRMATEVDFAVGEVIKELKKQGVYNKTMLIFTTDNGNLHGYVETLLCKKSDDDNNNNFIVRLTILLYVFGNREHGLAEKWFPFEESIKVPLVIQDPRMPKGKHGTFNDKFTLNIDLAPTILGAAKIKPSNFFQGRDIADLYLGKGAKWRKDFFYEYLQGDQKVDPVTAKGHSGRNWIDASFALVTKEWKYIYWPQQNYEQLFNRRLDPFDEFDLLTNSSTYKTPDGVYYKMQARYNFLKRWAQSGKRV